MPKDDLNVPADDLSTDGIDMNTDDMDDLDTGSSLELDTEDPVDVLADVPTGKGSAADAKADLTAIQQAFRERERNEQKRHVEATDSEYWFCVCFMNRDEKEQFLRAIKMLDHGDKYIDGRLLAKKLGVKIDSTSFRPKLGAAKSKLTDSIGTIE